MNKLLTVMALIAVSVCAGSAFAARVESGNNTKVYLDASNNQRISAIDADKYATNDKPVLQCVPVEKVCNERTGKCTLKVVK